MNWSSVKSTSNWVAVNLVDANYPKGSFAFIPKSIDDITKLFFILLDRKEKNW